MLDQPAFKPPPTRKRNTPCPDIVSSQNLVARPITHRNAEMELSQSFSKPTLAMILIRWPRRLQNSLPAPTTRISTFQGSADAIRPVKAASSKPTNPDFLWGATRNDAWGVYFSLPPPANSTPVPPQTASAHVSVRDDLRTPAATSPINR